jgi:hypothetical protein
LIVEKISVVANFMSGLRDWRNFPTTKKDPGDRGNDLRRIARIRKYRLLFHSIH